MSGSHGRRTFAHAANRAGASGQRSLVALGFLTSLGRVNQVDWELLTVRKTEEVVPCFYRCRYCGRWKDAGAFSSGQVQWASESNFSRSRRGRREPVCRGCAGFALHLERGVSETEVVGSLPLESRVALIMTFSGQYPGLPEFNEDILRCIFSFLMVRVAPRLSSQPPQPSCSAYFCPARDSSDRYRLQCEDLFRPPLWQMWEMAPFAAPSACATSPACPTSCSTSKHRSAMCALAARIRSVDAAFALGSQYSSNGFSCTICSSDCGPES